MNTGAPRNTATTRSFAIVPAAGRSVRMGRPKLLLPWGDRTTIEQVIAAWRASRVSSVVVVVHPDDAELAELCRRAGAEVVVASSPPPDMKASVARGLEHVRTQHAPTEGEVWLVAPADMPRLSSKVIDRLLDEQDPNFEQIIVPTHHGKRGHPVLFPWALATEVARLSSDAGLNRLLEDHTVISLECGPEALCADFDTPEDYRHLQEPPSA
jgi:molybdenum cofactor cytidylyltransferase